MTDPEVVALTRQGLRWLFAAEQDVNPVVRHLHYAYAVGWLEIVFRGATRDRIGRLTNVNIEAALERASAGQDEVQRLLIEKVDGNIPEFYRNVG